MWNLFKKSPVEEENQNLRQIQAQLEEAKKNLDSVNEIIKTNLDTLKIQEAAIEMNKDTITSQEEILRGYGILEDIGYQFENTRPYPKPNRILLRPKNNWPQSLVLIILLSIPEYIELMALKEKAKSFKKPTARIF